LARRDKRSSKGKKPDKRLKIIVSIECFVDVLPILDSGIHHAAWFSGPLLDQASYMCIQPMPDGIFQDLMISGKLMKSTNDDKSWVEAQSDCSF
jgi:hypothetical protein